MTTLEFGCVVCRRGVHFYYVRRGLFTLSGPKSEIRTRETRRRRRERHKDIKSDSELPQMVFITHNFMFACLLELLLRDGFLSCLQLVFSEIAVQINKKCVLPDELKGEKAKEKVLLNWRKTNECGEFGAGEEGNRRKFIFYKHFIRFPSNFDQSNNRGKSFPSSRAGKTSSSARQITALFGCCRDFCWKLARIIYRLERNKEILARVLFNLTRSLAGVANVLW